MAGHMPCVRAPLFFLMICNLIERWPPQLASPVGFLDQWHGSIGRHRTSDVSGHGRDPRTSPALQLRSGWTTRRPGLVPADVVPFMLSSRASGSGVWNGSVSVPLFFLIAVQLNHRRHEWTDSGLPPASACNKAVNLTALFHHLFSDVDFVVCTIPTCVVTKESFNSKPIWGNPYTTTTETTACKQNIRLHRCLLS
jgi:hypothetical protein